MLRGVKLTSLLKDCILELLKVSNRQDIDLIGYAERNESYLSSEALHIDLIGYAERNESYLSSEALHTGAPAGE